MRLKEIDEVPGVSKKPGKYAELINDFLNSGKPHVEVELEEGDAKTQHTYSSLISNIKKMKAPVRIVKRGNRIFLIRRE